jgi:hypothetical protein
VKIYALEWRQTGKVSTVEAYTDKKLAQTNADHNNAKLNQNFLQKALGRYWRVVTINVREGS